MLCQLSDKRQQKPICRHVINNKKYIFIYKYEVLFSQAAVVDRAAIERVIKAESETCQISPLLKIF